MYFPGDPLFPLDPIFNVDRRTRRRAQRLISRFDLETTEPEWALGYRFDIVLRGRDATPFEEPHDERADIGETACTARASRRRRPSGPFFAFALTPDAYDYARARRRRPHAPTTPTASAIAIEGRVLDGDGEPVPDAMIEIWQADADGRYAGAVAGAAPMPRFRGFGRSETDGRRASASRR